jgi:hypothetical protein
MASNINTVGINTSYPVAGQDNDTQGFRDNFTSITYNLNVARAEISDLQAKPLWGSNVTVVPTSSSSPGVTGQVAFSNNYLYFCIANNQWVRAAVSSF